MLTVTPIWGWAYLARQFRDTGGRFPQAMVSFIPEVTGPQAVFWADRVASTSSLCEADAQFWRPLNSTQTVQVTFCAERVEYASSATKARIAATVIRVFGFMSYHRFQEGVVQQQGSNQEVDHQPGHVDQGRDERGGGARRVELEPAQDEREHRPGE